MARNPRTLAPLPVENGLYYRSQHKDAPFSRANATTQNLNVPASMVEKYGQAKEGYSAFFSPHHVAQYHRDMGWDFKDRKIVAFRGTPVGEGGDGEPRVVPHTDKPDMVISPRQFHDRLEVTPFHGQWDQHTWGEGPNGRIADDGYRTLGQT